MSDLTFLNDLTKPATVLIEKIADATGVVYEPRRIKKNAKAEAEAMIIRAKAEIEIDDLKKRALTRFVEEEVKKQENIENIIDKTLPLLEENSENRKIEEDWIADFFDKCRTVSNDEMQILWAKTLAGEFNKPGSFSRRTLDMLKNMTGYEAQVFIRVSKVVVKFTHRLSEYIVFADPPLNVYINERFNITNNDILLLKDIGLLRSDLNLHFIKYNASELKNSFFKVNVFNFERGALRIDVEILDASMGISFSPFVLSKSGEELLSLTEMNDDSDLMENINKFFEGKAKTNPLIDINKEYLNILKNIAEYRINKSKPEENVFFYKGSSPTVSEFAEEFGFPAYELAEYNNLQIDSKLINSQIKIPDYFFSNKGNIK